MSLSVYPIGGRVWIVRTDEPADPNVPGTLPVDSVVLEPVHACALLAQLSGAVMKILTKRAA